MRILEDSERWISHLPRIAATNARYFHLGDRIMIHRRMMYFRKTPRRKLRRMDAGYSGERDIYAPIDGGASSRERGDEKNIAYSCPEDEGDPRMSLSGIEGYCPGSTVLGLEFLAPFEMRALLALSIGEYGEVGQMGIGNGACANQCMIFSRYGGSANGFDGVV